MTTENVFINQLEFHLTLTNLVVLKTGNTETVLFLMDLERDGVLPKTLTWGNSDGSTSHLYRLPAGPNLKGCYEISLDELRLTMVSGPHNDITMPPIQAANSSSRWIPGRSWEDRDPAELPVFALSWLVRLAGIADWEALKDIRDTRPMKTTDFRKA